MKNRLVRGSSLPLTMMFFMVIGTVTVVSVGLTTTTDSMVYRGVQKVQATELAESGINVLYDEICRRLNQANATPASLQAMRMSSSMEAAFRDLGEYSARVVKVTSKDVEPAPGFGADTVERTYTFELEGKGVAPNGTESIVNSTFSGKMVVVKGAFLDEQTEMKVFPGAIQSNTEVVFIAESDIRTEDAGSQDKEAHIIANRGVRWNPPASPKVSITTPDVIKIDGHVLVPDQPTLMHYQMSMSPSGLGNYDNRKNYQTAGPWVNKTTPYTVVADSVTAMGQPMYFADSTQVNQWVNDWRHTVTTSPLLSTATGPSVGFFGSVSGGAKKMTTPIHILGNFQVAPGETINLVPRSSDPSENVMLVEGNIENMGNIVNHGVILVTTGAYRDTSTASYSLSDAFTKYEDMEEVYAQASLLSTSRLANAITIFSDTSSRYGLVYAAQGGIRVYGNLEMNAILMSGGTQMSAPKPGDWFDPIGTSYTQSGIVIKPPARGGFTLKYAREAKNFTMPAGIADKSKILGPFQANRLTDWKQLK